MKKILFAAAVLAATISCAEQGADVTPAIEGTPFSIEVGATSKVAVDEDYKVNWVSGDALTMFSTTTTDTSTLDMTSDAGSPTASFSGDLPAGGSEFRLLHSPQNAHTAAATSGEAGKALVILMDQPEGLSSTFMISEGTVTSATSSVNMVNITAAITLNATFENSPREDLTLYRARIKNYKREATLDLSKGVDEEGFYTLSNSNNFSVYPVETVTSANQTSALDFNIFPFEAGTLSMEFTFQDSDGKTTDFTISHSVDINATIKRATHYTINTTVDLSGLPSLETNDDADDDYVVYSAADVASESATGTPPSLGDYYGGGYVYYVSDKTIKIINGEDAKTNWAETSDDLNSTTGATSTSSGADLTAAIIEVANAAEKDIATAYPAFEECLSYGTGNWYFISFEELKVVMNMYILTDSGSTGEYTEAGTGSTTYDAMIKNGMTTLLHGEYYFSANENTAGTKSKTPKVQDGSVVTNGTQNKTSSSGRYIRCSKTIVFE